MSAADLGPDRVNALAEELRQAQGSCRIPIEGADALALIGLLQLALRHPDIAQTPEAAEVARKFVRDLAGAVGPETLRLTEESW